MWPDLRAHILLLVILTSVSQGLIVIGPRLVRSHQNYSMIITHVEPELSKVELRVRMEGSTSYGRTALNITKFVDVQQNTNRLINFDIQAMIPGDYKIIIDGLNGFNFHKEAQLNYLPYPEKHVFGLIQLNKPAFKPGELIQFRVLVLDYELKPPQDLRFVTVVIKDPRGGIVRKWPEAYLKVGVYENRLLIKPSPLLGTYKIVVTLGDAELVSKIFEVKEYVLFAFEEPFGKTNRNDETTLRTAPTASRHAEGFLKIVLESDIQLSQPIKLHVTCRQNVSFLVYYVLSKGNVIVEGFVRPTKSKVSIELEYSDYMVPISKVLVATVVENTVVYDMADIHFDSLLNDFHLDVENNEVRAGARIQLQLSGRPGSYVALAAYDKGLLQYGSTHDLSWHDVEELYAHFHHVEPNEFDIFEPIGIFVRASDDLTLSQGTNNAGRFHTDHSAWWNRIHHRTQFAESFLWKQVTLPGSGQLNLTVYAPQAIAQWYITGFSMDPVYGLGIIKKPIELTTKKSFYIVDHLPYSIKRGQDVEMKFTLFNNGSETSFVNVTMDNVDNEIEFVGQPSGESNYTKFCRAEAHERISVSFLVKANKLGEIVVRVQASSAFQTDAIEKVIRVMPESVVLHELEVRSFYHDSDLNSSFTFRLDIYKKADPGSLNIIFMMSFKLLQFEVRSIEHLLSVPTGDGEQNMLRFMSSVIVLDYLKTVGSNDTKLMEKATNLIRLGYQDQMRYRQTDGSFGAWENSTGSVFLTAFVANTMQTASQYISEVDVTMLANAFEWLALKQKSNGRFDEVGTIRRNDMQGGLRNGISLTSFVLIAFMENVQAKVTHAGVVANGIEYVAKQSPNVDDLHELAIVTYALTLNKHNKMDTYIKELNERSYDYRWRDLSRDPNGVERAAYTLLAMVQAGKYLYALGFWNVLAGQHFVTDSLTKTQYAFVALKALSALADRISPSKNNYTVQLKYQRHVKTFKITPSSTGTIRINEIPSEGRKMEVNIAGKGFGVFDVFYKYSLDLRNFGEKHRFDLKVEKLITNSNDKLQLKICASFIPDFKVVRSSMTLVEVNFPSGFVVVNNPISNATGSNPIKKFELRFRATSVMVYYDYVGSESNCFVITAYRRRAVRLKRPAYVIVRDYYNPKWNAIEEYEVEEGSICETCDGDDCLDECML